MKKIAISLIFILLLSGCATYNAYNDPVYQSYLRGEISYDTYVQHVNNLNAHRINTINAIQQLNRDVNQAVQERYENKNVYTDCYYIGNQIHCTSRK